MSEQERWNFITSTLSQLQADLAVIKSQMQTHKDTDVDHEKRLRKLEDDVGNNRLVVRAALFVATAITGTGLTIAASVAKDLLS